MSSQPPLVAPFRGERFASTTRLTSLIAPPYDVISSARRLELAERDPRNMVHLILPEGRDRYRKAAKLLDTWRHDASLIRDERESIYVVQQEFTTPDGVEHVRTGVIAGIHVEPYGNGRIHPHERTHAGPKEDRLALTQATNTMLEAIFVLSPDTRGHLRRRLEGITRHESLAVASLDDVRIGLWRVSGVQAREVVRVAGEDGLYIADGHHRFETANAYRAERPDAARIPALIVPLGDPGLVVLPTHRIVRGSAIDAEPLVSGWRARYEVGPVNGTEPHEILHGVAPGAAACAVVLPEGTVHRLSRREAEGDEPAIVTIEREIVQPVVASVGDGAAVDYSADAAEVVSSVLEGDAAAGVLVTPTPVDTVLAVSDAGGVMPPKSTFFAPKVPSGLVWMPYDE